MNYSIYRFTLDVQSNVSQVSLPVKLNDTSRQLLISLTDGGEPYHISKGSLAMFSYKKAEPNEDGEYESGVLDCTIEDNFTTIRFDFDHYPQVTSVAGVVDCEIWLYGPNGRRLSTPRFILVVDERVMSGDENPLPEDKLSVLDSILQSEAERADAETKRVEAEIARDEACQELIYNTEQTCRDVVLDATTATQQAERAASLALSSAERVHDSLNEILSSIYPIGSIYMSMNSTSPATLFGGSWVQLKDRFLIGAGNTYSAGGQGGNASHNHGSGTLSALFGQPNDATATQYGLKSSRPTYDDNGFSSPWKPDKTFDVGSATSGASYSSERGIDVSGQTGDTDTLPPYLAVYMWHRIA